jgi:ribosomal-protein-alanine N-acetyltransferase
MILELEKCIIRSYQPSDAKSLAKYANNRKIWLNLRDGFPYPYTINDAEDFIDTALNKNPETYFAICTRSEAIGGIGYSLHTDVERLSAEIGYWLGEPFWGKGIVTDALIAVTQYAINTHGLYRVYAVPYETNKASFCVLEKAGYQMEGRMRKSAIKDKKIVDQLLFAYVI